MGIKEYPLAAPVCPLSRGRDISDICAQIQ